MDKKQKADINIVLVALDYKYALEVGRLLADQLEMFFLDSQGLYEFDIRPRTFAQNLEELGLDYFRNEQKGTIKYICSFLSTIMAIESGAVMNEDNISRLNENGLICYIRQPKDVVFNNLSVYEYDSELVRNFFSLSGEEIEERDLKLLESSEILVEDEGCEAIKCTMNLVKEIKKYYGVE